MTAEQREAREVKKHLRNLVSVCEQAVKAIDAEMERPSTPERGKRIAAITNFLETNKDLAKRFGLNLRPKKPKK